MNTKNYYGHIVRRLLVAGAVVMLLTYPYFSTLLPQGSASMIIGIVILLVFAGFTKPERHWTIAADIAASLFALIYFEIHAIEFAKTNLTSLFLTDQALTIIFLVALYFAAKTFGSTAEIKMHGFIPRIKSKENGIEDAKTPDPRSEI